EFLSLAEARANRTPLVFDAATVAAPRRTGVFPITGVGIAELRPFLDWTPFFQAWQLTGKYPAIFEDAVVGDEARKLHADAEAWLDRLQADPTVRMRGVAGIFPANADGDDILVWADEARTRVRERLVGLRQQTRKRAGQPNRALAD